MFYSHIYRLDFVDRNHSKVQLNAQYNHNSFHLSTTDATASRELRPQMTMYVLRKKIFFES